MFTNPNAITNVEDIDQLVIPRKGPAYREQLREMVEEQVEARNRAAEDSSTPDDLPPEATGGNSSQSPINPEEETFKKRYGDLRRHAEKQRQDNQRQLDDIRRQLNEATRKDGVKLPKTKEEVQAWMRAYPDVAAIVETIAVVKANEVSTHNAERIKHLEQENFEARAARAESELRRLHPKLDELRNDPALHEWAEKQHPQIQDWLYNNPDDATLCAKALDLFIAETKPKKGGKTQQERDLEASRQVRTSPAQNPPSNGDNREVIKESWILKLSPKEYDKYEARIDQASQEGRIDYDISGRK